MPLVVSNKEARALAMEAIEYIGKAVRLNVAQPTVRYGMVKTQKSARLGIKLHREHYLIVSDSRRSTRQRPCTE